MNSLVPRSLLWLFLAGSLLSLGLGAWYSRQQGSLDLSCAGRAAQLLPGENPQRWLLHRFDLDLRTEGLGDYRARLRLLDASSGKSLGYQSRTTHFSQRRQGPRLLVQVLNSGKSETDNLPQPQLAGVGLFVFNEQMHLTYRLRQLAPGSLLIDNGQGSVLLCRHNPSRP
ncbi:MAG: hypothetical protein ABWY06_19420 [Pseudomonas sp.]|uniref:hypothetical protein n=1 Tax=Pseudomonas sp. TaxID=306 RepID=UPI003397A658